MATKNMGYDHPTYLARMGGAMGTTTAGATTVHQKFVAFTAMLAFSAQITAVVAGTAATHGYQIQKVSGTATTALATGTLGVSAQGTTLNVALSTAAGGVALAQGDILQAVSLADATGTAAIAYEVAALPLANVTA